MPRHDLDSAVVRNFINPANYLVMWSASMREWIRWTWYYPTTNEVIRNA